MSTKIQKDIVCPACGQTQKLEMYTSVNAEENPELRRDILRESMFDWECLHCGYTAQMAYPMIYHDPMNAFMICLRPSGAVSGAEPIPAVRALKKRSVKNPQELKEKILIFEAGLDDAAVELVKNAIVTVVRKNLDGNVHAYFCAATVRQGSSGARVPDHQNGRVPPVAGGFAHARLQIPGRFRRRQLQARPKPFGRI